MDRKWSQRAEELDGRNPLRRFRQEFEITDQKLIYLDGNSLGRLTLRGHSNLRDAIQEDWGNGLVSSWGKWIDLPSRLGRKIAKLIGAKPHEVIVCDSTSVNLYKLVHAALRARPERTKIVTDRTNFPSDLYVLQGLTNPEDLSQVEGGPSAQFDLALGPETNLLCLTHTLFKSGAVYDMKALTAKAQAAGAWTLWDLSHSVGALPVNLNDAGAELAIGCTYKYLNGGPGAPAFLYVREDLITTLRNPIQGWFGADRAFDFELDYTPRPGIERFQAGTPNILSMIPVEAGVDLLLEAGMEEIRSVSLQMTDFFIEMADEVLTPLGFEVVTPRAHALRGSHVSLRHQDALAIDLALINDAKVIPDFRSPDNLRFGITPLYTTFAELAEAVSRIENIVSRKSFEKYRAVKPAVT